MKHGKMNRSLRDISGGMLVVSQFTLYGDVRRGLRPSWIDAAAPEMAQPLYEYFIAQTRALVDRSCLRQLSQHDAGGAG